MSADPLAHRPGIPVYVERWLALVTRRPWVVLVVVLLIAAASLAIASRQLGVNTDPADLLDRDLPFQDVRARVGAAFPLMDNTLLLVVEAPAPEQARATAEQLSERLGEMPEVFSAVDWPAGDRFLRDNGLLLRSSADLDRLADQLGQAQPMLARLARSPTVPGLFGLLGEVADNRDAIELDLDPVFDSIADGIEASLAGDDRPLSWQRLLTPAETAADSAGPAREVLLVQPVLDFGKVMAGRDAVLAARALRADMGLSGGPVRMRITGSVALAYEELQSVIAGASLAGLLALIFVTVMMYVGLRSLRLVLVALLSLAVGLSITLGFATLAIGHLNLISVAFTVLYVGLGVNYAIHLLLRYREGLVRGFVREDAVVYSGTHLLGALALSAATTAIGFFAFVPTSYAGVAELGLIAGVAMGITFAISYTLVPAVLSLIPPPDKLQRDSVAVLPVWLLDIPLRHPIAVRWAAVALAVIGLIAASQLRFDSDPLNLRDPESESVLALRDLLAGRATGHRNLQAIAPDRATAEQMSAALAALPSVDRAVTLLNFAPKGQDDKLLQIEELGPDILAAEWASRPAGVDAVSDAIADLRPALDDIDDAAGDGAERLSSALAALDDRLQSESSADRDALAIGLHRQLLSLLPAALEPLGQALSVDRPVALDDLPAALRSRWLSPAGDWLIQIFPAGDLSEAGERDRFLRDVRAVAPAVSGMPVIQLESGRAITSAFQQALALALIGIALLLLVLLRSVKMTVWIMLPLLLGGLLTAAAMVSLDIAFNFANVIALPLLLGVGVDNGVHMVYRHRAGDLPGGNVLRSATARGIVFGALTTIVSFGNLAFSPHAGTASMGLVLAVGLALMVLATLIVLPALLKRA